MDRPIFHLSFPVTDLALAKAFYREFLGASVGRDNGRWADIILFGHQLTLHHRPSEVLSPEQRGVRHFGAILPWQEWTILGNKLEKRGCSFVQRPTTFYVGTEQEQGKFLLCDPSGNVVEIKAYRNAGAVFGNQHESAEA